jgi:hypothetical protein
MKWVHIGLVQAGMFIAIMTAAEPRGKKWRPLTGGVLAMVLLYGQYVYAKACGIKSSEPGTEDYTFKESLTRRRGIMR